MLLSFVGLPVPLEISVYACETSWCLFSIHDFEVLFHSNLFCREVYWIDLLFQNWHHKSKGNRHASNVQWGKRWVRKIYSLKWNVVLRHLACHVLVWNLPHLSSQRFYERADPKLCMRALPADIAAYSIDYASKYPCCWCLRWWRADYLTKQHFDLQYHLFSWNRGSVHLNHERKLSNIRTEKCD